MLGLIGRPSSARALPSIIECASWHRRRRDHLTSEGRDASICAMDRMRRSAALVVVAAMLFATFGAASPRTVHAADPIIFACETGSGYLSSVAPERTVSQGQSAVFVIDIVRMDCPDSLTFYTDPTPPTAPPATFSSNPTTADSVTVTIPTSNAGSVTPPGTYGYFIRFTGGHQYPANYFQLLLNVTASIGPVQRAPVSSLVANTAIGATTVSVRTGWSATDPDGIAKYTVQRQVNGGAWTTVALATPTTTAIYQPLTFGTTYRYRVKATDRKGHASTIAYGAAFMPKIYQQNSALVTSGFPWTTVSATAASGGSYKYYRYSGSTLTFRFTGTSVAWVSIKGPARSSSMTVRMDGTIIRQDLDLRSTSTIYRRLTYAANLGSTNVTHDMELQNLGLQGAERMDVDAFVVLYRR